MMKLKEYDGYEKTDRAASDSDEASDVGEHDLEEMRKLSRYLKFDGPPTDIAVRPFDERFTQCLRYQSLDISHWNMLTLAAKKLRPIEEKQADGSILYRLEGGDDADETVAELLCFYNWERLTKQDVDKFKCMFEKARQEFRLIEYLTTADFILHDSSVESVIDKIPKDMITSIGYPDVKGFVERYTRTLKQWEASKLYYDFKCFLTECHWITSETQVLDYNKLKEDATFVSRGFHMIPYKDIIYGFRIYVSQLLMHEMMDRIEEGKTNYINLISEAFKHERLLFDKTRKRFPVHFTEPIHFLAFKEWEEKYAIQHPVVEIAKLRAFFRDFLLECSRALAPPSLNFGM